MAYEQKKFDQPNPKGYAKGIMKRLVADGKESSITLEYVNNILEKKFNTVLSQNLFDTIKGEVMEGTGVPMMSENKPKPSTPSAGIPASTNLIKDAMAYLSAKGADVLLIGKDGSVQLWTKTN